MHHCKHNLPALLSLVPAAGAAAFFALAIALNHGFPSSKMRPVVNKQTRRIRQVNAADKFECTYRSTCQHTVIKTASLDGENWQRFSRSSCHIKPGQRPATERRWKDRVIECIKNCAGDVVTCCKNRNRRQSGRRPNVLHGFRHKIR